MRYKHYPALRRGDLAQIVLLTDWGVKRNGRLGNVKQSSNVPSCDIVPKRFCHALLEIEGHRKIDLPPLYHLQSKATYGMVEHPRKPMFDGLPQGRAENPL